MAHAATIATRTRTPSSGYNDRAVRKVIGPRRGAPTWAPATPPTIQFLVKKNRSIATPAASVTRATWRPRARMAGTPTTAPAIRPTTSATGSSTTGDRWWSALSFATAVDTGWDLVTMPDGEWDDARV